MKEPTQRQGDVLAYPQLRLLGCLVISIRSY
jgi:hypothetical protein